MANKYADALYNSIQGIANKTTSNLEAGLPQYIVCKIVQIQSQTDDIGTYLVQPLGQPDVVYQAQTDSGKEYKINDEVQVQVINGQRIILGAVRPQEKVSGFFNFYYEAVGGGETLGPVYDGTTFSIETLVKQINAGGDLLYVSATAGANMAENDYLKVQLTNFTGNISQITDNDWDDFATITIDDVEGNPTDGNSSLVNFKVNFKLPEEYVPTNGRVICQNVTKFDNIKVYVGKSDGKPFDYYKGFEYVYITSNLDAIAKNADGTYKSNSITFQSWRKPGTGLPLAKNGGYWQYSVDGAATQGTEGSTTSNSFTLMLGTGGITPNTKLLVQYKESQSATNIHDEEGIPILQDGASGQPGPAGESVYFFSLFNDNIYIPCTANKLVKTDIVSDPVVPTMYYGTSDVTSNWTFSIESFNGGGRVQLSNDNGTTWHGEISSSSPLVIGVNNLKVKIIGNQSSQLNWGNTDTFNIIITATKNAQTPRTAVCKLILKKQGNDGTSPYQIDILNDFDSVPATANGVVSDSYDWEHETKHIITAWYGSTQLTFTLSSITPTGSNVPAYTLKYSYNGLSGITLPSVIQDINSVTIHVNGFDTVGTDTGFVSYELFAGTIKVASSKFEASKNKQGVDGMPAIDYKILCNNGDVVKYNPNNGVYTNTPLSFTAKKIVGNNTPENFAQAHWKLYKDSSNIQTLDSSSTCYVHYCSDGTNYGWYLSNSSTPPSSPEIFSVLTGDTITLQLFNGNNQDSIKLEAEELKLLSDGQNGQSAAAAYSIVFNEDFITAGAGADWTAGTPVSCDISLTAEVYKGSTLITDKVEFSTCSDASKDYYMDVESSVYGNPALNAIDFHQVSTNQYVIELFKQNPSYLYFNLYLKDNQGNPGDLLTTQSVTCFPNKAGLPGVVQDIDFDSNGDTIIQNNDNTYPDTQLQATAYIKQGSTKTPQSGYWKLDSTIIDSSSTSSSSDRIHLKIQNGYWYYYFGNTQNNPTWTNSNVIASPGNINLAIYTDSARQNLFDQETITIIPHGDNGEDATRYYIEATSNTIYKNSSNEYIPTSITLIGKKVVGSGTPTTITGGKWKYQVDSEHLSSFTTNDSLTLSLSGSGAITPTQQVTVIFYNSSEVELARIVIPVESTLPIFITAWDGQKTKIDNTSVLSIQAGFGKFLGDEDDHPVTDPSLNRGFIGVALGSITDSNDSHNDFSGIIGYNSNWNNDKYITEETFRLDASDGSIVAKKGEIAGWTVNTAQISKRNSTNNKYVGINANADNEHTNTVYPYREGGTSTGSPIRFYAGTKAEPYNCEFRVDEDGSLYASKATIEGDITANSLSLAKNAIIPICRTAQIQGLYNAKESTISLAEIRITNSRTFIFKEGGQTKKGIKCKITAIKNGENVEGLLQYNGLHIKAVLNGTDFYIECNKIYITKEGVEVSVKTNVTGTSSLSRCVFENSQTELGTYFTRDLSNAFSGVSIGDDCLPSISGSYDLGSSDFRWKQLYATNATIDTSSRLHKQEITPFSNKYEIFFNNLQPCHFKYNHENSDRVHYGFILDEVGEALKQANLTSIECGAYCLIDPNNPDGDGGLRYEEFIALNTWQIQKLKARVSNLEQQIQELRDAIQQQH